jgi:hypothetical protein
MQQDLGEIVFNCKESEQQITVKVSGDNEKLSINTNFVPPLTDDLSMTPILQSYITFMKMLRRNIK